ncbi:AGAP003531-PA-like protein [Anopheles sinensis]|uniref:AGAP003531-PA-like protein n=1 Tax=Anopheles sinensis TaxID=74873 RepID=A0A084VA40_ANOSI|nr:AGAP003531-PA-like protein [Anopheles sinensis]
MFVIEVDEQKAFEKMLAIGVDLGCQAFVVTEQTADSFFEGYLPVHDAAVQRFLPKRLLVVLEPNSEVFPRIPKMLVIEELPEVLILLPVEDETVRIDLYTVDIYDGDPITIVTRLLDVINCSLDRLSIDDRNVHLFPDKLINMNKRRLRLAAAPYLPNIHVQDMPLGQGNARYILPSKPNVSAHISGTELWLIELVCEIANCTPEVMIDSEWGDVFENGTKFGVIGAAAKHEADIAFGGLYTWYATYQHLAFSAVHSRSGCTCIVAKPCLAANWRTPFLSFSGSLWCAVFCAFIIGALALVVVFHYRQRILALDRSARLSASDSVLLMIGFFMEQGVPMPNELAASCLLFGTLMFAGFMIGSSYNGGLASTMIVPQYEKAIDNETISRHAFERDVAIIVERMEYGHFAHPRIDLEAMRGRRMLVDDIYWTSVIAACSKTWPTRLRFDRMILDLKAHGILEHWELIAVNKFLGMTSQQTIRYSRDGSGADEGVPLGVANITGALLILGAGLSLAMAMFAVEICWHNIVRLMRRRLMLRRRRARVL